MISSDSLSSILHRAAGTFFFLTEQEHRSPPAVQLPVFGDRAGISTCRWSIGLTHLQPFPWQNTSPCPSWFPTGECNSCWHWALVMSWEEEFQAFPWHQLLCGSGGGRGLFCVTREAALGSGLELGHSSCPSSARCQLGEAVGQISRLLRQRAAPAAQTSAWDVISYLWRQDFICWNMEWNYRLSIELIDVSPDGKCRLEGW